MRTRTLIAAAAVLVALLFFMVFMARRAEEGPSPPAAQAPAAGEPATGPAAGPETGDGETPSRAEAVPVAGFVRDGETGRPLAGVQVEWSSDDRGGAARTGEDGGFSFAVPPDDNRGAWLLARGPDLVARGEWISLIGLAEGIARPVLFLWSVAARLPGRVVDLDGRPVEGACVLMDGVRPPFVSDTAGRFGPVAVGARGAAFEAWHPRYALAEGEFDFGDEALPAELLVEMGPADLTPGVVVDEGGRPLPGAEVFENLHPERLVLTAAADGTFRWPLAPAVEMLLEGRAGCRGGDAWAFAGAPVRLVLRPFERGRRPIAAPRPPPSPPTVPGPAVTLVVAVFDPEGAPVAGADVTAEWMAPELARAFGRTDGEGLCRFTIPSEVPLHVEAVRPDGDAVSRVGKLAAEPPEQRCELRFGRPTPPREEPVPVGVVAGRVLDAADRPVQRAWVEDERGGESTFTDLRGRFELPLFRPAETLRIGVTGYPEILVRVAAGSRDVLVRLPARGAVRVRLVNPPKDREGVDFACYDSPVMYGAVFDGDSDSATLLDEGDSIRIDGPAGVWWLTFRVEPGAFVLFSGVTVRAGEETLLTYGFPSPGTLTVRVCGPDGAPVSDARVTIAETGGEIGSTGGDGVLVADSVGRDVVLPCGVHALRVIAEGFAPFVTRAVDLGRDNELEVRLAPGGRVRGTVVDGEGAPAGDGIVEVLPEIGPPLFEAYLDDDGTFEIEQTLAPGPVRLRFDLPGRERFTETAEVREGEVTDLRLTAPPPR